MAFFIVTLSRKRRGLHYRENLLITEEKLKVADLGSCRGIYSKQPYTEYISTRWYRPPECLLTDGYYTYKMDIWGAGCVMFEITSLFPLFPGNNELDQIHKIHNILGTPPKAILDRFQRNATHMDFNFPFKQGTGVDRLIPHASPECIDIIRTMRSLPLLGQMLIYDPDLRISARKALKHPFFKVLRDGEVKNHSPYVLTAVGPQFLNNGQENGNSSKNLFE